jgi:nucleotidyltransferase substrate binding protein (TIGR01987 family)
MPFMNPDIRWKQRFQHFDRALMLLREALQNGVQPLSMLEKDGLTRRFNSSLDLAWKTAEDYLEAEGIDLCLLNPRDALKQSCAAGVIKSDETWIEMVKLRRAL